MDTVESQMITVCSRMGVRAGVRKLSQLTKRAPTSPSSRRTLLPLAKTDAAVERLEELHAIPQVLMEPVVLRMGACSDTPLTKCLTETGTVA